MVAGAYKRTPIRSLETETNVPPLDIYLSKRLADFEARLEATKKGELIRNTCAAIARRLRNRRGRPRRNRPDPRGGEASKQWAQRWVAEGTTAEAMQRDWKARWEANWTATQPRREGREPADRPDFTADTLRKYNTLRKYKSSTLV